MTAVVNLPDAGRIVVIDESSIVKGAVQFRCPVEVSLIWPQEAIELSLTVGRILRPLSLDQGTCGWFME